MLKRIQQIQQFIDSKAASPAQKSLEWYSLKQKTIGGSEVSTVLGINPWRTLKALIAEKAGIADCKFEGNINTRWGILFEQVTKEWTELVLNIDKIFETGSIEGVIEGQRYSPDGLGVVKLRTEDNIFKYFIILFEFKSPLRSLPDGKIPKYYKPQLQTGMLTIPLTDTSIFVNNCYRKCALADIGFSFSYDTDFHDGDAKKFTRKNIPTVFGCGMICFYQTLDNHNNVVKKFGFNDDSSEDEYDNMDNIEKIDGRGGYSNQYDIDILMNSFETPVDYGTVSKELFDRVLELYEEKQISAIYYPIIPNIDALNHISFLKTHKKINKISPLKTTPKKIIKEQYNSFMTECDNNKWVPVGYLPWKLIKSDIICEDKDDEWLSVIKDPIEDTLARINKIITSADPSAEYNSMYPNDNKAMQDCDVLEIINDCMYMSQDNDNVVVVTAAIDDNDTTDEINEFTDSVH